MSGIRVCFETLGCKVNQYETQAIETLLVSRGHTSGTPGDGCDAIIINTCAVTAESGRKSRQAIRHLRKVEPGAIVAVCGCFAQISPDDIESLGADLISGSGDRRGFVDELERVFLEKTVCCVVDDPETRGAFEELPSGNVAGRTRAMIKIQDGCRNFCAYCIIPYARGPIRSLPIERTKAEAERLGEEGFSEIVVTGIEISSYGKDFTDGTTLIDAIQTVSAAAPVARLRLGSLEPRTITESFCAELKKLPNICDHFHLSLQSGCDETLARMKRRYNTNDFMNAVNILRQHYPRCGLTADLIVGFPGETDEEFAKTLAFIKECDFSSMHIFPYSIRPGTAAAEMPSQIDKFVKKERARKAAHLADEMSKNYAESFVGSVLEVLFERETSEGAAGHAGNYLEVCVSQTGIRKELRSVRVLCKKEGLLFGEIIES